MRLSYSLIFVLLLALLSIAACSDDLVQPQQDEQAPLDKRPREIENPPPGFDQFFVFLRQHFDEFEEDDWIEITVDYAAKTGGVIEVVPEGYPTTHPIRITTFGDATAEKAMTAGTLWVLAAPPSGGQIYMPGGSIPYRTLNLPAPGEPAAKIDLPIMSWYYKEDWTGEFTTYELTTNTDGWPDSENEKSTTIAWPNPDPDETLWVTVEADPNKDGPTSILDQVADPQEPGDEI